MWIFFLFVQIVVEVAPAADVPWPPPLEEALDENLHGEYVSTSNTPLRQVSATRSATNGNHCL